MSIPEQQAIPETNHRGQTYEQAIEAFRHLYGEAGAEAQHTDVPALVRKGAEVWSFGYGDGWMDPDGYTTLTTDDLWAFEGSEADASQVAEWAPFLVDLGQVEHLNHLAESDPACVFCQSTYDDPATKVLPYGPDGPAREPFTSTITSDPDYLDEYLRVLAESATELRVSIARWAGSPTEDDDLTGAAKDLTLASVDPQHTAASQRAFRDLATGLAAATSPARVR